MPLVTRRKVKRVIVVQVGKRKRRRQNGWVVIQSMLKGRRPLAKKHWGCVGWRADDEEEGWQPPGRKKKGKTERIEEQKSGRESFWMAGAICDIQPIASAAFESLPSSRRRRLKTRQHFLENNDPVRAHKAYPPSPFSTPVSRRPGVSGDVIESPMPTLARQQPTRSSGRIEAGSDWRTDDDDVVNAPSRVVDDTPFVMSTLKYNSGPVQLEIPLDALSVKWTALESRRRRWCLQTGPVPEGLAGQAVWWQTRPSSRPC